MLIQSDKNLLVPVKKYEEMSGLGDVILI